MLGGHGRQGAVVLQPHEGGLDGGMLVAVAVVGGVVGVGGLAEFALVQRPVFLRVVVQGHGEQDGHVGRGRAALDDLHGRGVGAAAQEDLPDAGDDLVQVQAHGVAVHPVFTAGAHVAGVGLALPVVGRQAQFDALYK